MLVATNDPVDTAVVACVDEPPVVLVLPIDPVVSVVLVLWEQSWSENPTGQEHSMIFVWLVLMQVPPFLQEGEHIIFCSQNWPSKGNPSQLHWSNPSHIPPFWHGIWQRAGRNVMEMDGRSSRSLRGNGFLISTFYVEIKKPFPRKLRGYQKTISFQSYYSLNCRLLIARQ